MGTIKHAIRGIVKGTKRLLALVAMPALVLVTWLALIPRLPSPVTYVPLMLVGLLGSSSTC